MKLSEESQEEESESSIASVVPLAQDFSRRQNRGKRMNKLVGKALEEDDDFWGGIGAAFFGGSNVEDARVVEGGDNTRMGTLTDEDDQDFNSEMTSNGGEDSFDSDFNHSENEPNGEQNAENGAAVVASENEEELQIEREEKREATKKKVKFQQQFNKDYNKSSKRTIKQDQK